MSNFSGPGVALVTGGSRGIGAAIVVRLAELGFKVAIGYREREQAAQSLSERIQAQGGQAIAVSIEVASRSSVRGALDFVEARLGAVDTLVNNAAIAQEKPFLAISDEDWNEMLGTNLRGPFACIQEALPGMLKLGRGRIVNIVSIGGQWGGINQIHYASAKAGLIGLTRSVAKTFARQGITCNAVSPGLVQTEMTAQELATAAGQEKARSIPTGRLGLASEVAAAVAYLVSPGSEYVTGQTLNVNGGMYFG